MKRASCTCDLEDTIPAYEPWLHALRCELRRAWNEQEHTRELEYDDDRAERRRETN